MNHPILSKNRAVISTDAIRHNYRGICQYVEKHALGKVPEVICVVKADAYGHGVDSITDVLGEAGCRFFALSSEREALTVRGLESARGREPDILILGYTFPENVPILSENHITCAAVSAEHALALSHAVAESGSEPLSIHVKLDTGMNRVGFAVTEESADEIAALSRDPHLRLTGLFTHFACCDDEKMDGKTQPDGTVLTDLQWARYQQMLDWLRERGVDPGLRHAANSAGILAFPEAYLDAVRAGIVLYGLSPNGVVRGDDLLHPVMRLETTVGHIHTLPAGEHVSYGATYTAKSPRTLATLTIGYADGFSRHYADASAAIHGKRYPIVGRICMDQCMVDITGDEDAIHPGDTAVLFGDDRGEALETLAHSAGTINYECTCAVSPRVERIRG